jgi:hypothetical protein
VYLNDLALIMPAQEVAAKHAGQRAIIARFFAQDSDLSMAKGYSHNATD